MKSLLLLAIFVALAVSQAPTDIAQPNWSTPIGVSGNGTIWYQSDTLYPTYTFQNIQNPVQVSVVYEIGSVNYEASICYNYLESAFPIDGVDLAAACPAGALGSASNGSAESLPPAADYYAAPTTMRLSKSKFISSRLAMATPTDTTDGGYTTVTSSGDIYVKPGSTGGFIVTIPDSVDKQRFNVFITGKECGAGNYPVGASGTCVTIPTAASSGTVSPATESWSYLQYTVPDSVNSFTLAWNVVDDLDVYAQRDYYPTQDWFMNGVYFEDEKDGSASITVVSPIANQVYFFGFYNSNDETQTVDYNVTTVQQCADPKFGYNCLHDTTNTTSPFGGIVALGATLAKGVGGNATSNNNGTAWSYDFYDDDDDDDYTNNYAYFSLYAYPQYPTPYYIRVSVGNNDADDENGAPAFFASQGSYPSAQSNVYNMSTIGDSAHQILVKITEPELEASLAGTLDPSLQWNFAVQLPADFSIWVGVNCAGNCSNGDHGDCYCGNQTCVALTGNGTNYNPVYTRTYSLEDSAGACTCSDDDYENSFDCSQRSNGNSVLYIVLIAVGGAIVLAVAIGVPLYCFFSNRKTTYDKIM